MKKILLIISIVLFVSCETENNFDTDNFNGSEPLTYFTGLSSQQIANGFVSFDIVNPEDNTYEIEVGSTIATNSDRNYTVSPTQATLDAFPDLFSVEPNVTIPADGYVGTTSLTINTENYPSDGDVELVFDLSGPDIADFQNQLTLAVVVVIPVPADRYVESTWSVSTVACFGDAAGGCDPDNSGIQLDYTVDMTPGSENSEFILSDITGGLYTLAYGASDNPATIYEVNGNLFLEAQPDVVYGSDQFDGTGSIQLDADGNLVSFTIDWSNGYGDAGTSVFTLN